ncbi:MAG: hypothetical protein IMW98_00250 [Firmicutes bacterium]|nr:hypothetical protein [Bacillota bacterium]
MGVRRLRPRRTVFRLLAVVLVALILTSGCQLGPVFRHYSGDRTTAVILAVTHAVERGDWAGAHRQYRELSKIWSTHDRRVLLEATFQGRDIFESLLEVLEEAILQKDKRQALYTLRELKAARRDLGPALP